MIQNHWRPRSHHIVDVRTAARHLEGISRECSFSLKRKRQQLLTVQYDNSYCVCTVVSHFRVQQVRMQCCCRLDVEFYKVSMTLFSGHLSTACRIGLRARARMPTQCWDAKESKFGFRNTKRWHFVQCPVLTWPFVVVSLSIVHYIAASI